MTLNLPNRFFATYPDIDFVKGMSLSVEISKKDSLLPTLPVSEPFTYGKCMEMFDAWVSPEAHAKSLESEIERLERSTTIFGDPIPPERRKCNLHQAEILREQIPLLLEEDKNLSAEFARFSQRSTACILQVAECPQCGARASDDDRSRALADVKAIPSPSITCNCGRQNSLRLCEMKEQPELKDMQWTRQNGPHTVVLTGFLNDSFRLLWVGYTLHYYNFAGWFAAIPAEVMRQLPSEILDRKDHLYYTCNVVQAYNGDGHHRAVTRVWIKTS